MTNPNLQKLFCETFGIHPMIKECQNYNATLDNSEMVHVSPCGECFGTGNIETFPALTLDLLFAVAKREGIEFSFDLKYGGFRFKIERSPFICEISNEPTDCVIKGMLRFRGINVENL